MSALTRIAYGDHQNVSVERGDTVIISAKPVPGQRAARPRLDQPARAARGRGAAPGDRAGARLGARVLGGDAHAALARAAEGGDADPRRVPDARGARAARAGRRDPGRADRDRRERLGRRADARRRRRSSTASTPASPSSTGSGVGDVQDVALRDRRRLSEDGVLIVVTTVAARTTARDRPPELIARGVRRGRRAARRASRRGRPDRRGARAGRHHGDQARSRSTSTTRSGSWSTHGRDGGR